MAKTYYQLDRETGRYVKKTKEEVTTKKMVGIGSGNNRKPMTTILIEKLSGNLQAGSVVKP